MKANLPLSFINNLYANEIFIAPTVKYQGDLTSKFLIITDFSLSNFQSKELTLLKNILNACKTTLEKLIWYNLRNNVFFNFEKMSQFFSPKKIVFFTETNIKLFEIPETLALQEIKKIKDIYCLSLPNLSRLVLDPNSEEIRTEKKILWDNLRELMQL